MLVGVINFIEGFKEKRLGGEGDFGAGDVVEHQRYGYRGVVVAWTAAFEGSAEWYEKNLTQPAKDQPWYHVLVDGSASVTYAAESSLELDHSGREVAHPLLEMFFSGMEGRRYVRNEIPWQL
jgi:heat shock protein HspQ